MELVQILLSKNVTLQGSSYFPHKKFLSEIYEIIDAYMFLTYWTLFSLIIFFVFAIQRLLASSTHFQQLCAAEHKLNHIHPIHFSFKGLFSYRVSPKSLQAAIGPPANFQSCKLHAQESRYLIVGMKKVYRDPTFTSDMAKLGHISTGQPLPYKLVM